ncbi:MAG: hypothetical protein V8S11_01040 [Flavonifractor plautii]
MKIRFLEPGNRPYKPTPLNYFVYDRYIRTPSVGLNTLATIVKELVDDTYMYSESISRIDMDDVEDADIVFIGIFTFAAVRGYELADHLRAHGRGLVVLGGLHASMNCAEAARHCDYVLLGEGDETIRAFVEAVGRGERPDFPGLAWMEGEELRSTGYPPPPERFETIADRNLVHNYSKMVGHSTLWPQVHASRGCPHNCDYCALVRHFGRRVRTRSPENVVADIRESIRFFHRGHVRLAKISGSPTTTSSPTGTGPCPSSGPSWTAASATASTYRPGTRWASTTRCSISSGRPASSSWIWASSFWTTPPSPPTTRRAPGRRSSTPSATSAPTASASGGCSSWAPTTRRRAWATSWPTSSSRTTSRAP